MSSKGFLILIPVQNLAKSLNFKKGPQNFSEVLRCPNFGQKTAFYKIFTKNTQKKMVDFSKTILKSGPRGDPRVVSRPLGIFVPDSSLWVNFSIIDTQWVTLASMRVTRLCGSP